MCSKIGLSRANVLVLAALLAALATFAHCDTPGATPDCDDSGDCFAADAEQPINTYHTDGGR
jgi:hypothetical protein